MLALLLALTAQSVFHKTAKTNQIIAFVIAENIGINQQDLSTHTFHNGILF